MVFSVKIFNLHWIHNSKNQGHWKCGWCGLLGEHWHLTVWEKKDTKVTWNRGRMKHGHIWRREAGEKVKSTRLCFSHECRVLVSSSEYRPWVGCLTLSLRSYSAGTASDIYIERESERERERERERYSLSRTQWLDAGSPSHLLAFLSAVPIIIGENLWGHSFYWI